MKSIVLLFICFSIIGCSHKLAEPVISTQVVIKKNLKIEVDRYSLKPCLKFFSIGSLTKNYASGIKKVTHFCIDNSKYFQYPLGYLNVKEKNEIEFCSMLEPYAAEYSNGIIEHGWVLKKCHEVKIKT